jgi:hypothetical protein
MAVDAAGDVAGLGTGFRGRRGRMDPPGGFARAVVDGLADFGRRRGAGQRRGG